MKNLRKILLLLFVVASFGCEEDDFGEVHDSSETFLDGKGFFIVNEGNFTHSSGSISFYSFDSSKIYNNLFYEANDRPLGDVPQHMVINDTTAWLVVNNSSKIEQVSLNTFRSKGSITGLTSPRQMHLLGNDLAYVSDLYSDTLSIVDLATSEKVGGIYLGRSSESMVESAGKVFVANWSNLGHSGLENNKIMVIDPVKHQVVDSVEVAKEPNSMVVDKDGHVWVLCSGGYSGEETPALHKTDPETVSILKSYHFENENINPSELSINRSGDTLYFLNQGVFRMPVDAAKLPTQSLIPQNDRLFYALGLVHDHVAVSDAVDYQQKGIVYLFSKNGAKVDSVRAGIIPGFFREK